MWEGLVLFWSIGAVLTLIVTLIQNTDEFDRVKLKFTKVVLFRRVLFWFIFVPALMIDFGGRG